MTIPGANIPPVTREGDERRFRPFIIPKGAEPFTLCVEMLKHLLDQARQQRVASDQEISDFLSLMIDLAAVKSSAILEEHRMRRAASAHAQPASAASQNGGTDG